MTDTEKQADEIAALKKKVEALESALSGKEDKPPPKKEFVPETDAEHQDRVHRMRERQANSWMPPDAIREMVAAEPKGFMQGVVADNRAPTSPGTIPHSEQPSNVRPGNVPGSGTGWAHEIKLGPQPGIDLIDRGVNAPLPHGPEWGKEEE